MRDIIDRLSRYEQISDDPIIFRDAKAEINKLREELEEAKEPCESPCSRGFELISENKGLRDRLKISIEYVDGIPTGYGEDEIDRQQAEIEKLKEQIEHMSVAIVNSDSMQLAWERIQEIDRLKDSLVISNTTIANLHSEIEKGQKEIKKLRIQITDDLSTAYDQQAEIKKLKEDNRIVISALEDMHMMESETVEELREELALQEKEYKESLKGWLIANAPGGWIDQLRIENKRLRNLARDFYSDRYINEVLRDALEKR